MLRRECSEAKVSFHCAHPVSHILFVSQSARDILGTLTLLFELPRILADVVVVIIKILVVVPGTQDRNTRLQGRCGTIRKTHTQILNHHVKFHTLVECHSTFKVSRFKASSSRAHKPVAFL